MISIALCWFAWKLAAPWWIWLVVGAHVARTIKSAFAAGVRWIDNTSRDYVNRKYPQG
jgi:hypothetical protein